jgi:hypothetical protein
MDWNQYKSEIYMYSLFQKALQEPWKWQPTAAPVKLCQAQQADSG